MNKAVILFLGSLKRVQKTIVIIVTILVIIRIVLPFGMKHAINWYLDKKMVTYQGHIDDFDLALYRGSYQIQNLKIWKRTSPAEDAFVDIQKIDVSLAWRALLKFKVLADLEVEGAKLIFVDSEDKKKEQLGADGDWKDISGKLLLIELESVVIRNSEVHFLNKDLKVPFEIVLDRIDIRGTNINNTDSKKELLPSTVTAKARFQRSAPLSGNARMNLISRVPAFDANLKLEKFDITKMNSFFRAYGPFTFTSGTFSFYAEVGTKNSRVKGYIKPFFENLDLIDSKEKFDSPKRFFNEVALATGNLILRNSATKAVATKIEFEGASQGPNIETWGAVWSSLKNGFVQALAKSFDNSISIQDVPKKR